MRLSCGAIAWIALGAATAFLLRSEKDLVTLRHNVRAFDLRAREAVDALFNLRVAQQAYVADGQSMTLWAPKVTEIKDALSTSIATLEKSATASAAQSSVGEAATNLREFASIDKRVRDYLNVDERLMAGDVIFTEGGQAAEAAALHVESARVAERTSLDARETDVRTREAIVLAGAGGVAAFVILLLGFVKNPKARAEAPLSSETTAEVPSSRALPDLPVQAVVQPTLQEPRSVQALSPELRAAAELCTDFGCVRDVGDLELLLARAADAMSAAGLVVWLGSADGAFLDPILVHGYSDDQRARLPRVARSADNAAAAAYRSGEMQLILAKPGEPGRSSGAIVAPMLSASGCIGALSAEIRDGVEPSEHHQALAAIVASQLTGVLATAEAERPPNVRAAASS